MIVERFPDRTITVKGKEFLYFGGTSYLGMATQPEFQELLSKNLQKWGTFYGSSRSSNIQLSIYSKAEKYITKYIGSEASLTVSSGMLAGKLTIDCLAKTTQSFFHYPKSHPAILKEGSLPLFVKGKLHPKLLDTTIEEIVITADAVLALEATPTSFDFLAEIPSNKKITLVIDESHSLGIVGEKGSGIFSTLAHQNIHRKILISSMGKALGLPAGVIASDNDFIERLKNDAVFVSASGASPAHLETFIQAENIYNTQRNKLQKNLDFFFKLNDLGESFIFDKNYPVIYCKESNLYDLLFKQGIVIANFKYPTYKNFMSRIVITANHTEKDLIELGVVLKKYC